jgi:hypothetical protein
MYFSEALTCKIANISSRGVRGESCEAFYTHAKSLTRGVTTNWPHVSVVERIFASGLLGFQPHLGRE